MPYVVTIKPELADICLPGNIRVQGGTSVRLSDTEYALTTASARNALFAEVEQADIPVSKEYVGFQDVLRLSKAGGTMTGDLAVTGRLRSSVNEVVGLDVGDGGVIRLPHRLQHVVAEDRGGGAADAAVAGVGVVP